jgi:hypothetical protein
MPKFPVDAPKAKVVKSLELLGFQIVREREHISMVKAIALWENPVKMRSLLKKIKCDRY